MIFQRNIASLGFCLLALQVITAAEIYAQNPEPDITRLNYKNRVYVAPVNFTNIITPSIQMGYERAIGKKYSAQLEMGLIPKRSLLGYLFVDVIGVNGTYWYTNGGFRVEAELKRYFQNPFENQHKYYISLELFYFENNGQVNDFFRVIDSTYEYPVERPEGYFAYDDFFEIQKQKVGINLKYGFIADIEFVNGLDMELHIGLGISQRNTIHIGRMKDDDPFVYPVMSQHNQPGRSVDIVLPWNVKLGYHFKQ